MEKFNLKKFRATRATEWLRPKWLGGCGYDIATVKNLLGHDKDSDSIWAYVRHVENEILVAEMNKEKEKNSPAGTPQVPIATPTVFVTGTSAVGVFGMQADRKGLLRRS